MENEQREELILWEGQGKVDPFRDKIYLAKSSFPQSLEGKTVRIIIDNLGSQISMHSLADYAKQPEKTTPIKRKSRPLEVIKYVPEYLKNDDPRTFTD